jgi:prepilin-type N-terminal cleavage/methylation domain-containing protein
MRRNKGNNKGFSLVELIVVMAIMAILAVTVTPRLTQYIDKARQTNDREIPNAVFTAVRLALLDDTIVDDMKKSNTDPAVSYSWATGVDILDEFYERGTASDTDQYTVDSSADPDLLAEEIIQTLGSSIRFQSRLADTNAVSILVTVDSTSLEFTVDFRYGTETVGSYTMNSADVR